MAVAGTLALGGASSARAMDYEVNDTAGMGDGTCDATCTLRDAITTANGTPVDDTISFEFPGAGPFTIAPTTDLPALSAAGGAVEIDGTTENSYVNAPVVELDGTGVAVSNGGLVLNGNDSTVRGLSIFGFATAQVVLASGSGQSVMSNYLGVQADGVTPVAAVGDGVSVLASGAKVGVSGQGNVMSGNVNGLETTGAMSSVEALGNIVGLDATGQTPVPNANSGILVNGSGPSDYFFNTISGNSGHGIRVQTSAGPQQVYTNRIGTNQDGDSLGNGGGGVRIEASDVRVAALAGGNNEIAFNGGAGVEITGGVDSQVLHNSIHDNVGLGIDIGADGALETPDAGDADVGPNNRQNYPVLDPPQNSESGLRISGVLEGPSGVYRIAVFSVSACDGSGNGEGETYLWDDNFTVVGPGDGTKSFTLPFDVPVGTVVTATATSGNGSGDTSEFSPCTTVQAASTLPSDGGAAAGGSGSAGGAGPVTPAATQAGPVLARSANVGPVSGSVLVRRKGSKRYSKLTTRQLIPVGSIIDARKGRVRVTVRIEGGKTQTADFYGGVFQFLQRRAKRPVAEMKMVGALEACPKAGRSSPAQTAAKDRGRRLWGSGKGRFRTSGKRSAATVRGTIWLVEDRCDSTTLTQVRQGSVTVRDFAKRKNVVVKTGRSYVARRR